MFLLRLDTTAPQRRHPKPINQPTRTKATGAMTHPSQRSTHRRTKSLKAPFSNNLDTIYTYQDLYTDIVVDELSLTSHHSERDDLDIPITPLSAAYSTDSEDAHRADATSGTKGRVVGPQAPPRLGAVCDDDNDDLLTSCHSPIRAKARLSSLSYPYCYEGYDRCKGDGRRECADDFMAVPRSPSPRVSNKKKEDMGRIHPKRPSHNRSRNRALGAHDFWNQILKDV